MKMNIHQLQVIYQIEEDRILIRLNTLTGEEFRLSLTRRMMRRLFPYFVRESKQTGATAFQVPSHDGANNNALDQFKKQELLHLGDFQTPFSNQVSVLPIGEEPLLATTIHVNRQEHGSLQLRFEEQVLNRSELRSFEVTMGVDLFKGFMHLLESALDQADWGFSQRDGNQETINQPDDGFPSNDPPKYLN